MRRHYARSSLRGPSSFIHRCTVMLPSSSTMASFSSCASTTVTQSHPFQANNYGMWTSSSLWWWSDFASASKAMHSSHFTCQRRTYVSVGDTFSIAVPPIAESVSSGKLKEWTVKVGDTVAEDQELCHIESDKLEIPVRSPCAGVIVALNASEGEVVDVGKDIAVMTKGNAAATPSKASIAPTNAKKPENAAAPPVSPSPSSPTPSKPNHAVPAARAPPPMVGEVAGGVRRVRTSTMRLRIADRLKASQNTAAMLTTFNEIDMHNLITMREKYKDEFMKKHGVKLGFMSAFTKASASALQEVPIVNASWEDEHIVYHDYVDISVAVATPNGLVVPVLRNVQSMSFADVEKKIAEYGKKAKDKTITLAEMTGGTFTISNGGVFGSWLGTPIINPPQSAILGIHATKQKPWVAEDGKSIVVRPIMAVALTYDHRLIDGRDAVTFLVKVKNIIEDPQRLLLDL